MRKVSLRADEIGGREGGAAASGKERRQAHHAAPRSGGLHRRKAGRSVQGGSLPVLSFSHLFTIQEPPERSGASFFGFCEEAYRRARILMVEMIVNRYWSVFKRSGCQFP